MRPVTSRSDRGAVIVLMAMSMIMLLTFAALAVDYGALTNERRRDQTSADGAALAAGGQLLAGNLRPDAVDEAILVSWENLETGLTLEEWRQRFDTDCTDPDKPAGYTASTLSDCISFNAFNTRVRVKLPDLSVPASFARVIGVDTMESSAFAEAEIFAVPGSFGRVLPFAVPPAGEAQTELCLKTSGSVPVAPCGDPLTPSQFGSADISLFGNPALGTPELCGDTAKNQKLAANMILGTDHPLDEYNETPADPLDPIPETIRNDHDQCPNMRARPNELWAEQGVGSALDPGIVTGRLLDGRWRPGRLTQGPQVKKHVKTVGTVEYHLDNRPLWEYIPRSLASPTIPEACLRSTFDAHPTKAQMATCLDAHDPTLHGVLFTEDTGESGLDILETPRYGFVPLFYDHPDRTDGLLQSGNNRYQIRKFLPIFLQSLYFDCNNSPAGCRGHFHPGEPGIGLPVGNKDAAALTAFTLPPGTLPPEALTTAPGGSVKFDLTLRR